MFDLIPVFECIGVDDQHSRVIRTLGYVEQLHDGTLKARVYCDTVPDHRRVYTASLCMDCTAYPTSTLADMLTGMCDTVYKLVTPMLWYSTEGDGMNAAPDMVKAIIGALSKYEVVQ